MLLGPCSMFAIRNIDLLLTLGDTLEASLS